MTYTDNFDKYIEESKEAFDDINTDDMINIKLRKFENQDEFKILLKYLRKKYKSSFLDWMIHDGGGSYFWHLYKEAGLKETIDIRDEIKQRFKKIKNFRIIPFQNLFPDTTTDKPISIKLTKQQSAEMENLSDDMNIYKYQLTWIYAILFFNRGRKDLEDFVTEDFKLHYEKNGYFNDINKEISNTVRYMINGMIDMIPEFIQEIGTSGFLIEGKKTFNNDINDLNRILNLKIESLDKLILLAEKNNCSFDINVTNEIQNYKAFKDSLNKGVP